MDKTRGLGVPVAVVAVFALLAWLLSFGGHAKVRAQAEAAMNSDDHGITGGPATVTGIVPEKWVPHIPANAHMGRHRMYRHPRSCSPVLTAPAQVNYDWLYSPPSEGDL